MWLIHLIVHTLIIFDIVTATQNVDVVGFMVTVTTTTLSWIGDRSGGLLLVL